MYIVNQDLYRNKDDFKTFKEKIFLIFNSKYFIFIIVYLEDVQVVEYKFLKKVWQPCIHNNQKCILWSVYAENQTREHVKKIKIKKCITVEFER